MGRTMTNVLLLGSGKIGAIIAELLVSSGDYSVTVADWDKNNLARLTPHKNVQTLVLDVTNEADLRSAMLGQYAALSACPFDITKYVAQVAADAGVHYFDSERSCKKCDFSANASVWLSTRLCYHCSA